MWWLNTKKWNQAYARSRTAITLVNILEKSKDKRRLNKVYLCVNSSQWVILQCDCFRFSLWVNDTFVEQLHGFVFSANSSFGMSRINGFPSRLLMHVGLSNLIFVFILNVKCVTDEIGRSFSNKIDIYVFVVITKWVFDGLRVPHRGNGMNRTWN